MGLAEEILASSEQTLDLREVPNFARLVKGLSQRQLAYFCRVLAMLVMEPEVSSPFPPPVALLLFSGATQPLD